MRKHSSKSPKSSKSSKSPKSPKSSKSSKSSQLPNSDPADTVTVNLHSDPIPMNPYVLVLQSIFFLYIYHRTSLFFKNLKQCDCAPKSSGARIATIESIYFWMVVCWTIFALAGIFLQKYISPATLVPIVSIYFLGSSCVAIALWYNVYVFWKNLPSNCTCAQGWEKWFVYYQAVGICILPVLMVISFFVFALIALKGTT